MIQRRPLVVIRGGAGLFYENSIWNNVLFDPAGRLQKGFFLAQQGLCPGQGDVTFPDGAVVTRTFLNANICGQPIGSAQAKIVALQQQYQAATKAAGAGVNPSFVGNTFTTGIDINATSLLAPNYKTPRSVQMNIGIQRELRRGMVLTVDYLRNVSTHNLLSIDTNHVGDARFLKSSDVQTN